MGFEAKLPLLEHEADKDETSEVLNCDSTLLEEVKQSLSGKPFLQVRLENNAGTESLGTTCDLENNKADVAEAITTRADAFELSFSSGSLDDSLSFGCETPRESIFDPFAPGPEEVACAPKKVIRNAEVPSRRQLNFDSGDYPVKQLFFDSSDAEEEDQYLQVLYKMILDLIMPDTILDQQKGTEKIQNDSGPHEICKTPDSKPLLTGIATTCPDAPLRPSHKVFKLSPSICRKIDFDSVCDSVSPRSSVVKENN